MSSNDTHDQPITQPIPARTPFVEARKYRVSVEAGISIEDVATGAQRTVAHVNQRLKLLELAPEYEGNS